MDIHSGQCVAVLSASGSGKSTFACCLAGPHPPASGAIRLDGTVLDPDARARNGGQRAAVQLPAENARRLPRELSGGERQRVALTRALAAKPAVLVCDEITAALDTATQTAILDLLAGHCRDTGPTVVLITHNLSAANRVAHDIRELADGRLSPAGSPEWRSFTGWADDRPARTPG